jgi:hypothetical protein
MNTTNQEKICKKCAKPISAGTEIKIEEVLETHEHYIQGSSRWNRAKYIYSPARTAIYYFCPECYENVEQETIRRAKKQDRWEWIMAGLLILIGLTLMVALIWTRNK